MPLRPPPRPIWSNSTSPSCFGEPTLNGAAGEAVDLVLERGHLCAKSPESRDSALRGRPARRAPPSRRAPAPAAAPASRRPGSPGRTAAAASARRHSRQTTSACSPAQRAGLLDRHLRRSCAPPCRRRSATSARRLVPEVDLGQIVEPVPVQPGVQRVGDQHRVVDRRDARCRGGRRPSRSALMLCPIFSTAGSSSTGFSSASASASGTWPSARVEPNRPPSPRDMPERQVGGLARADAERRARRARPASRPAPSSRRRAPPRRGRGSAPPSRRAPSASREHARTRPGRSAAAPPARGSAGVAGAAPRPPASARSPAAPCRAPSPPGRRGARNSISPRKASSIVRVGLAHRERLERLLERHVALRA